MTVVTMENEKTADIGIEQGKALALLPVGAVGLAMGASDLWLILVGKIPGRQKFGKGSKVVPLWLCLRLKEAFGHGRELFPNGCRNLHSRQFAFCIIQKKNLAGHKLAFWGLAFFARYWPGFFC